MTDLDDDNIMSNDIWLQELLCNDGMTREYMFKKCFYQGFAAR